jgi:hypothetical protein
MKANAGACPNSRGLVSRESRRARRVRIGHRGGGRLVGGRGAKIYFLGYLGLPASHCISGPQMGKRGYVSKSVSRALSRSALWARKPRVSSRGCDRSEKSSHPHKRPRAQRQDQASHD